MRWGECSVRVFQSEPPQWSGYPHDPDEMNKHSGAHAALKGEGLVSRPFKETSCGCSGTKSLLRQDPTHSPTASRPGFVGHLLKPSPALASSSAAWMRRGAF